MYRDTVTLFNRYQSNTADVWYPTILYNVNLNVDRAAIVERYGENSKDNAILNVRYSVKNDLMLIENKTYLPPKEWERLPNDELSRYITFDVGNNFSFFIKGEWGDGKTPISEADYDGFYEYMNKRYDDVFSVSSASLFSVIPHFEVLGK